ncbi:MAG: aminotransferase class IV [Cyclobacteriaceae bacterium]
MKYILNNALVDSSQAHIHISDVGLLRAYGIFDFFRIQGRTPLYLDAHIERFIQSANQFRLKPTITVEEMRALILNMLATNKMEDSGVRMVLTGGSSANGFDPGIPNLIITQEPLNFAADAVYQSGVGLMTLEHMRELPEIKTTNYLTAIYHWPKLAAYKASDILYKYQGEVYEVTRSNFFIIDSQDIIYTANKGILRGINRAEIIRMCGESFEVQEQSISLNMVMQAKEAFITGTTKKIMPIVRIDNRAVGNNDKPGKITQMLMQQYEERVKKLVAETGHVW